MADSDPRNLVLLCTSQGVAVQQDGRGAKRLFHHAVDESGQIHRYWLEAESSDHKVGGPQRETDEERADALARGKATSTVIGTRAMGTRFNVLMTIQVPLKQKERRSVAGGGALFGGGSLMCGGGGWGGSAAGGGGAMFAMSAPPMAVPASAKGVPECALMCASAPAASRS